MPPFRRRDKLAWCARRGRFAFSAWQVLRLGDSATVAGNDLAVAGAPDRAPFISERQHSPLIPVRLPIPPRRWFRVSPARPYPPHIKPFIRRIGQYKYDPQAHDRMSLYDP